MIRLIKRLKVFAMLSFALLLAGCSSGYRISQAELQQVIDDELPVSQSIDLFLFSPQVNLDSLELDLGQVQPGKVGLKGGVSFSGIPNIEPVSAKLLVYGRPEFAAQEGAIYLRDIDVRSLQLQGTSTTGTPLDLWLADSALDIVSQMTTEYFARYPIYTLEEGSLTKSALQHFGKDVIIGDGELQLSLAP